MRWAIVAQLPDEDGRVAAVEDDVVPSKERVDEIMLAIDRIIANSSPRIHGPMRYWVFRGSTVVEAPLTYAVEYADDRRIQRVLIGLGPRSTEREADAVCESAKALVESRRGTIDLAALRPVVDTAMRDSRPGCFRRGKRS